MDSEASEAIRLSTRMPDFEIANRVSNQDVHRANRSCQKVHDPFYGKRKPSATIKRIQRKISLQESRKKREQDLSSDGFTASGDEQSAMDNIDLSINEIPDKCRLPPSGQKRFEAQIASGTWITKDDIVSELFRLM